MEFRYRAVGDQAPNPPVSSAGQFLPPNYLTPEFSHHNELYKNPSPIDVQEAMLQRQLEKDIIRDEIIAEEMARRRILEAEVRRELMVEKEVERRLQGVNVGFSYMPGHIPASLPGSLEERIKMLVDQRLSSYFPGHCEIGNFVKEFPFQREAQPKISEVKPLSEISKYNENGKRIINLAKSDANLSGNKRKAVTPPTEGAGELPLIGLKEPKTDWNCAICQVRTTSEHGLNEHIQGKKHKANEAKLRTQRTGKTGIGLLCLKETSNPNRPEKVSKNPISEQGVEIDGKSLQLIKARGSSFLEEWKKESEMPFAHANQDTDGSKKKNGEAAHKKQKILENKENRYTFWCEMCLVGVSTEKVMNTHKMGKKHMSRLQKLQQNGGTVPVAQMVGFARKGNEEVVEDGKKDAPESFD